MALKVEQKVTWKRASEIAGEHTLFGDNSVVSPLDIRQGWLGNCWFLSAASSLAEVPGRLESIFLNHENELNAAGIYGFNFWTLGVKHTVIVDDWLPLQGTEGNYRTTFAKAGRDNSLWGALFEKAFAKYHGNYEHLGGGHPTTAANTLNGGPFTSLKHKNVTFEDVWAELLEHDGKDDILQAGSPGSTEKDDFGIVNGHAYSVLGVATTGSG